METLEHDRTAEVTDTDLDPIVDENTRVRKLRHDSLAQYEYDLFYGSKENSDHPWWPFFDGGVQSRDGTLWSVYNRWYDEEKPDGWKVVRCGQNETDFREIPVTGVRHTVITKPSETAPGLITFELLLHDTAVNLTNNDVLNVMLYHDDSGIRTAKLKMWNQQSAMKPIDWQGSTTQL